MAVPPAPDGDAVGEPSDSPDTTTADDTSPERGLSQGVRRRILIGAVGVLVVCLALAAFFVFVRGDGTSTVSDRPDNPQADRDRVMAVSRTFATQVATYGPDDLDDENRMPDYVARIEELLTPKFATGFEQSVTLAEQVVSQQQVSRTAQVYAVAVSSLDDDSARVLVAGTDTFTAPNPKKPEEQLPYAERTFRFEVALVHTQGEWLVDNYGPAGTLDEAQSDQLPTEAPGETPSVPPTSPSQGGGEGG